MPTLNYAFVNACAGGGHVRLDVTLNGGATRRIVYTTDEIRAPLSNLSTDERESLALLILKVHFAGMTRGQMSTALQAPGGVDVVI
jgi:hypothetical protein